MPIWRRILQGTKKVSPAVQRNVSNIARISNLDLRYDEGVKTLTFYANVKSSTFNTFYSVIITFKGVERTDGLTEDEINKGFQPKPTLSKNEIMIRCSCNNYRFRFDQANRKNKVGTGARFPIYRRKTNRKSYNPRMIAGTCKHVIELLDYLQKNGFIH